MPSNRVMVYDGPHRVHVEERDVPAPGAGEVQIRVAYTGICGSDLHGYTGKSGRRIPGMVMGHEASGTVSGTGTGVDAGLVGRQVTFNPALYCDGGCGHGAENHCAQLRVIGVDPAVGLDQVERPVVGGNGQAVGHVEGCHEVDHPVGQQCSGVGIIDVSNVGSQGTGCLEMSPGM